MINLNKLRNHLAHHEPICKPTTRQGSGGAQLTLSVNDVYQDLVNVLRWTDSKAADELLAESRVQQLLSTRPT